MITHPTSRIFISRDALKANYFALKNMVAPTVAVASVIKANGYGLGVEVVVNVFEQQGCEDFFVASLEEGVTLRAHTQKNIYILNGFHGAQKELFQHYRLIPILSHLKQIEEWGHEGECVWHIDTGMNRLGLRFEELDSALDLKTIPPVYILSHLSSSEEKDSPANQNQLHFFQACKEKLRPHFPNAKYTLSNSSGIYRGEDFHFDMVRPGYALYGGNPCPGEPNPLRNVVTVEARINQIHQGFKGEPVGYNQTHILKRDTLLAVVDYGYADGLLRTASNRGQFIVAGHACPIVGRVSMDLTVIDITDCPTPPQVGDYAALINDEQTIDDVAVMCQTNGWHILTTLSRRAQYVII